MQGTVEARTAIVEDTSARYAKYLRYIASPAWRFSTARLAELEASGFRCRVCNAGGDQVALQVHHRTYEHLYAELAEDLTTLCARCHRDVTAAALARRYSKQIPKRADVVSPLGRPKPIEDPIHGARYVSLRDRYRTADWTPTTPNARRSSL